MITSEQLNVGNIYTRKELREKFNIQDANINNGVFRPLGHESVWLFVTEHKSTDRTQYSDYLDGECLYWDGQTKGRTDHLIINHARLRLEIILFYRKHRYENPGSGFKYEGVFEYASHEGQYPAHYVLCRVGSLEGMIQKDLQAEVYVEEFFEGGQTKRFSNYYERNAKLRTEAILFHGLKCLVCGFDFEKVYGERGAGYIEVHHLKPISSLKEKVKVDPKTDMAVVCANCHRMIHRTTENVLTIADLKSIIRTQKP